MEQQLQILINREWIASWADRLLVFLSNYSAWAPWLLLLVVAGLVFGSFKLRAALLTIGLAVGFCDGLVVNFLKHTVERPRPSQLEPGVRSVELGIAPIDFPKIAGILSEPLVRYPLGSIPPENSVGIIAQPLNPHQLKGRSFPSAHAANNMAIATVLILFYPRRGWLYLPIALLISYARIYTGSHWPLDVVAGIFLGIGCGWMSVQLIQFLWKSFGTTLFPKHAAEYPKITR